MARRATASEILKLLRERSGELRSMRFASLGRSFRCPQTVLARAFWLPYHTRQWVPAWYCGSRLVGKRWTFRCSRPEITSISRPFEQSEKRSSGRDNGADCLRQGQWSMARSPDGLLKFGLAGPQDSENLPDFSADRCACLSAARAPPPRRVIGACVARYHVAPMTPGALPRCGLSPGAKRHSTSKSGHSTSQSGSGAGDAEREGELWFQSSGGGGARSV
jgi:hypothetical protein